MKKKITIILFAMLAALPISVNAQNAKDDICVCVNNKAESLAEFNKEDFFHKLFSGQKIELNSSVANIIDSWIEEHCGNCGVESPEKPETPDNSENPETPNTPDTPVTPSVPEQPNLSTSPDIPTTPNSPEVPETPETPDNNTSDTNISDIQNSQYVARVIELVNAERQKRGLSALKTDSVLCKAAQTRAYETTDSFSHTRPSGQSCFTVLDEYNYKYSYAGENIAMGQNSPEEVVQAWMNSQGHRENILKGDFTKIGMGCISKGGTFYWTQLFAG